MTNTKNTKVVCGNCDGTGLLPHYAHYADGVCFECHGTGRVAPGAPRAEEVHTMDTLRELFRKFRLCMRRDGDDGAFLLYMVSAMFQVASKDAALVTKILAAVEAEKKGAAASLAKDLCQWRYFRGLSGSVQRVVLAAQWVKPGYPRSPWKWGKTQMEPVENWTFNEG